MNNKLSTQITLWVGRLIGVLLIVMIFVLPPILDWYGKYWSAPQLSKWIVAGAYYLCLPGIFTALWNIDRMLCSFLQKEVFTAKNVERIRRIRWCCAAVGVICLPVGHWFTPLYFLAVMMFFLAFILSVVKNVMAAALELREENDLTI